MTADTTLTVGPHTITVDYETALQILQTCAKTGRRGGGGLVPISPDIVVWVTQATPLSITEAGRFEGEYESMITHAPSNASPKGVGG